MNRNTTYITLDLDLETLDLEWQSLSKPAFLAYGPPMTNNHTM